MLNAPPRIPETKPKRIPHLLLISNGLMKWVVFNSTKMRIMTASILSIISGAAFERNIAPIGMPITEPTINNFSSEKFINDFNLYVRIIFMTNPQIAAIGIASLTSSIKLKRGIEVSAKPNPEKP